MAHATRSPRPATPIADVVRYLLFTRGYTGAQCKAEFGVGLSWFSEFMRGRRPEADLVQCVYEKLTGNVLFDPDTPTMQALPHMPKGRVTKRAQQGTSTKPAAPAPTPVQG